MSTCLDTKFMHVKFLDFVVSQVPDCLSMQISLHIPPSFILHIFPNWDLTYEVILLLSMSIGGVTVFVPVT